MEKDNTFNDFDSREFITKKEFEDLFNKYVNIDIDTEIKYLRWNAIMTRIIFYLYKVNDLTNLTDNILKHKLHYENKKYNNKIKLYNLRNRTVNLL